MSNEHPFRIHQKCELQTPPLIVGWRHEIGGVATSTINFLKDNLNFELSGEIRSSEFFSLDGVSIQNNVIQFPESNFYSCQSRNILLFQSDVPNREPYSFLNAILDYASGHCKTEDFFSIGGFASATSYLSPRKTYGAVTHPELKSMLDVYNVDTDVNYQTPPQSARPSLNHFLLWMAQKRRMPGCSLWVEVPFYLAAVGDPTASKALLQILDNKFKLGLDLGELDSRIHRQNEKMYELKNQDSDIKHYLELLDQGIALNQSEGEILAKEVSSFFHKNN